MSEVHYDIILLEPNPLTVGTAVGWQGEDGMQCFSSI